MKCKFNIVFLSMVFLMGCTSKEAQREIVEEPIEVAKEEQNTFFFPENTQKVDYNLVTQYFSLESAMPAKTQVSVELMAAYDNGNLYEMKICETFDEYSSRYEYRPIREGHDRFHLGYFYVQDDKIYRILDIDAQGIEEWSEEELISKGAIICQSLPMEDKLEENEFGWHESIIIQGDFCRYIGEEEMGENGFLFESFVWEKGRGLVEYRTGHGGARTEYLEIRISENTIEDRELINEQETAYKEYLTGWRKSLTGDYFPQNSYFLFKDVDGAGLEELCIRNISMRKFFIVKYKDGDLDVIYSMNSLNIHPYNENGEEGLLYDEYAFIDGQNLKLMSFAEIDRDGNCHWSPLYVYWYDGKDEGIDLQDVSDVPFEEVIDMDWQGFYDLEAYYTEFVTNPVYNYYLDTIIN